MKNLKFKQKHKISEVKMNLSKVSNIEFDGIHWDDYPDFSDAYISKADYDGIDMTEQEIEELNEHRDFVHSQLWEHLF